MGDEHRQLRDKGLSGPVCLFSRSRHAHDDVAQQTIGRARVRALPLRESQDIRGLVLLAVDAIELPNAIVARQNERQLRAWRPRRGA